MVEEGGGQGGGGGVRRTSSWKLKKAAKKILLQLQACGSFSFTPQHHHSLDNTTAINNATPAVSFESANCSLSPPVKQKKSTWSGKLKMSSEMENAARADSSPYSSSNKNLCAICLDPLNYSSGSSPGQAIFTAQCSHSFHFTCISSNVRHGSVTCPICRAHWTQLPHNLTAWRAFHRIHNQADPVLQILDDSIATFRVHRRSFLRSARYDDDDPIEPRHMPDHPSLHLSLLPVPLILPRLCQCSHASPLPNLCRHCESSSGNRLSSSSSLLEDIPAQHVALTAYNQFICASSGRAYLSVKLANRPAIDLVLVASPNGPHLRLMKQSMALVVFSLRSTDRLAIVTYSSAAARVFPLRCMTSYGKRTALQVIDRLFYMGQADPVEGLKKGVKILGDRVHKNPQSCILHLSDSPTRSYHHSDMEVPTTIHRFHVGFGFGTSNGFVMHEFEDFLARILWGALRDVKLRICEDARTVSFGELRGGDERRIPVTLDEAGRVSVKYSYIDTTVNECRTGEMVVDVGDKRERNVNDDIGAVESVGGRSSSVECWDYHDPFMARRWAKHLHGQRA